MDLRDVVSRAAHAIEALAEEREQTLEVRQPGEPVVAEVDGDRLGHVLRNLLANAQKYGREQGSIVVELEERADQVRISVTDDGPGIPVEDQERIFERFYRVGGSAAVQSAPGAGSTFTVTLPRTE